VSTESTAHAPAVGGRTGAVAALCLVQFVDVLGVTVVVTALPAILRDLHAPGTDSSLITTAYAMFFGGLLMLGARLGDRYGHRRLILLGLSVFAMSAVLAATTGVVAVLTVARCLQGCAAAASVPSALRTLTTITPDGAPRQRAIAAWSASGAAAGASGFVVGGVVTDLVGWRAVFWAYLPLAAGLGLAVWRSVPRDPPPDTSVRIGPGGALTFTAAVMSFVVATTLLPEHRERAIAVVLAVASVVLLVAFVVLDRRSAAPLVPGRLILAADLRAGTVASLLNTFTTSSAITLTTLYLQNTLGRSPLVTAAMLVPFSLAVVVGSSSAARLLRTFAPRAVITGGLAAIAIFDFALVVASPHAWGVPLAVVLGGFGIGLSSVASTGLATDVDEADRGAASGIVNTAAQLGTALGVAAVLLVAALTSGVPAEHTAQPTVAWCVAGAIALAGAVLFARSAVRGRSASVGEYRRHG